MKKPWSVEAAVLGSLLVGGIAAGCALVTGSTDGYTQAPQDASTLVCTSAADCAQSGDAGDAGALICCLGATITGGFASACVSTCPIDTVEMCATSAECQLGTCMAQSCPLPPVSIEFKACLLVPECSVVVGEPSDAGAGIDSGAHDAGVTDAGELEDAGG